MVEIYSSLIMLDEKGLRMDAYSGQPEIFCRPLLAMYDKDPKEFLSFINTAKGEVLRLMGHGTDSTQKNFIFSIVRV